MAIDFSEYQGNQATASDLETLTNLAARQVEIEDEIAETEQKLKDLGEKLRTIAWQQLPEMMEKCGAEELTIKGGYKVKVEKKLQVSVPKKNKEKAYAWVEDQGGSALVKRAFVIAFDKEQEKFARKFKRDCEQRKNALPMEETKTVHSQTLNKFLRDKMADGVDVPLDLFGGFQQKIAKITTK